MRGPLRTAARTDGGRRSCLATTTRARPPGSRTNHGPHGHRGRWCAPQRLSNRLLDSGLRRPLSREPTHGEQVRAREAPSSPGTPLADPTSPTTKSPSRTGPVSQPAAGSARASETRGAPRAETPPRDRNSRLLRGVAGCSRSRRYGALMSTRMNGSFPGAAPSCIAPEAASYSCHRIAVMRRVRALLLSDRSKRCPIGTWSPRRIGAAFQAPVIAVPASRRAAATKSM